MKTIVVTDQNVAQIGDLQRLSSNIFDKLQELNWAIQKAGEEGFDVETEQDTYQTREKRVPLIRVKVFWNEQ